MKKLLFLIIIFQFFIIDLSAQIQINGEVDKSNFPNIEFVLHNRNPEISAINDFKLTEIVNGDYTEIDSLSFELIDDTINYSLENKCVLILFEELLHVDRLEQVQTLYEALYKSIDVVINSGDKVKIVAFSLRDGSTNILKDVTSEFTDDISEIKDALDSYNIKYNVFTKKPVSDIMGALEEGIELLTNQENSLPKSILLLSEERKNTLASLTANDITEIARSKDIVINTIKYNRSAYHQHLEPTLSKETYGFSKVLSPSTRVSLKINSDKLVEAESTIIDILDNTIKRASGNKYLLNIPLLNNVKDGLSKEILIKQINSKYSCKVAYTNKGNWIVAQFQQNLLISCGVILLILILFAYLINVFINNKNKKKILLENTKRKQRKNDKEHESKILKQEQEILNMKNKEQQRINSDLEQKQNILNAEKEKLLIAQMKAFGAFPILKYTDKDNIEKFEINKPLVSIGRDNKTNTITIPNSNISRNHLKIIFLENTYTIIDNNSLNGMIVNGYKVKNAELKNGDIIEIADVTFTFYI